MNAVYFSLHFTVRDMAPEATPQAPEEAGAATAKERAMSIINGMLRQFDGEVTPETIINELRAQMASEHEEVQSEITAYIGVMQASVKTDMVAAFEKGKGGEFDGSRTAIATSVLEHNGDLAAVESIATEISNHENHHAENDHTADLKAAPEAQGGAIAVINGEKFDDEGIIEPETLDATGTKHTSERYKGLKSRLEGALSATGQDMNDVTEAIEKKDMSLISDESRETRKKMEDAGVSLAI